MEVSTDHRRYLASEFRSAAAGMDESASNAVLANYFYSAVYGAVARVLNMEYSPEIVLLHLVTQASHALINGTVEKLGAGLERSMIVPTGFFGELAAVVRELADAVESDRDYTAQLERMAQISYVLTGNGNYLFRSRGVGLS
jgi:hypothetical protein